MLEVCDKDMFKKTFFLVPEIQPKIVNTKTTHHPNINELPEDGPKKSESCYGYGPSQNEIPEPPLSSNTRCTIIEIPNGLSAP